MDLRKYISPTIIDVNSFIGAKSDSTWCQTGMSANCDCATGKSAAVSQGSCFSGLDPSGAHCCSGRAMIEDCTTGGALGM